MRVKAWKQNATSLVYNLLSPFLLQLTLIDLQSLGFFSVIPIKMWARIAQPVQQLATGWKVHGSNPDGGNIGPGTHSASYKIGTGSLSGAKAAGAWH